MINKTIATLIAFIAMLSNVHAAETVNVNIHSSAFSGLGPIGSGFFWNLTGTSTSLSSLTADDGVTGTSVGFVLTGGLFGTATVAGSDIALYTGYRHNQFGPVSVTINGLDDSKLYNVALFGAQKFSFPPGRSTTFTHLTGGVKTTAPTTFETFIEDDNYVLYQQLSPVSGEMVFDIANGPGSPVGILNGFQIQVAVPIPEPSTYAMLGGMLGLAMYRREHKAGVSKA